MGYLRCGPLGLAALMCVCWAAPAAAGLLRFDFTASLTSDRAQNAPYPGGDPMQGSQVLTPMVGYFVLDTSVADSDSDPAVTLRPQALRELSLTYLQRTLSTTEANFVKGFDGPNGDSFELEATLSGTDPTRRFRLFGALPVGAFTATDQTWVSTPTAGLSLDVLFIANDPSVQRQSIADGTVTITSVRAVPDFLHTGLGLALALVGLIGTRLLIKGRRLAMA